MEAGSRSPRLFHSPLSEKIQSFCRKEGSQLLPFECAFPEKLECGQASDCIGIRAGGGIDFLDLNPLTQDLKIDWKTDSYDGGDHLNLSGAEKVTDYLGEYLKQRYHFSTPLPAPMCGDSWKAGLKEYLEQV